MNHFEFRHLDHRPHFHLFAHKMGISWPLVAAVLDIAPLRLLFQDTLIAQGPARVSLASSCPRSAYETGLKSLRAISASLNTEILPLKPSSRANNASLRRYTIHARLTREPAVRLPSRHPSDHFLRNLLRRRLGLLAFTTKLWG